MKSKNLRDLEGALTIALKQYDRYNAIRKLVQKNTDPFAQVLLYENLIVFQIGIIFERINLLHLIFLFRNNQKAYHYDLPNFIDLMEGYTFGNIIKLSKSALTSYPDVLKELNKFNSDRNRITHKMFDVKKISSESELLRIAKNLAILGKKISSELKDIAADIDGIYKKHSLT